MQHLLRDKAGFLQLAYRTEGAGPVIILLHGFPDDGGLWREVVPQLSADFTVVCPDLPGAGESSLSESNLTIEHMAEAVNAVSDATTSEPFLLVGHSMGGYAALAFAERFGARLSGLALIHSTAAADDEEKQAQRQKAIALIRKGGKEAFMKDAVPRMFSSKTRDEGPGLVAEQVARGLRLPDASAIAYYEAMIARPDRTAVLRSAAFPVQWILGKDDALIPLNNVSEQAHISQRSSVTVYGDCGHLSMLEAPEDLAQSLREFAAYCYKA